MGDTTGRQKNRAATTSDATTATVVHSLRPNAGAELIVALTDSDGKANYENPLHAFRAHSGSSALPATGRSPIAGNQRHARQSGKTQRPDHARDIRPRHVTRCPHNPGKLQQHSVHNARFRCCSETLRANGSAAPPALLRAPPAPLNPDSALLTQPGSYTENDLLDGIDRPRRPDEHRHRLTGLILVAASLTVLDDLRWTPTSGRTQLD